MRVKTFRGDSSASVLKRIKAELGADAVILSTRNFKEEGAAVCEMTAALEHDAASSARKMTPAATCGTHAAPGMAGSSPPPQEEVVAILTGGAGVGSWQQEWLKIREHLLTALKPQLPLQALAPRQRLALEYLEREGVDDAVLADLVAALHGKPACSVLVPLADMALVAPLDLAAGARQVLALAGPHGVGKTTAAIRLALQARRARPGGRICLVNADAQRAQSRMLLRQYAELAGLHYREIAPGEDATVLLEDCGVADLLLVDLPALSRGETMEQLMLRLGLRALEAVAPLRMLLALSPHYAPTQLRQFGRQYQTENMAGLLWTKLDEAYTFGNLVNTAHALGLPAVAFSASPGLQDDLTPASHRALWELLFKHRLPGAAQPQ
ncbi:flagellar biosynthesis protein FlhF [Megalodesulfovibrio gigas]|uniref:Putative GTP-binding signal recognition particle SRP54 G-domain-containing protein n=1 Tax=Megalodesulfovibrio gigas (strain ATCC 19364 / DSM 1382 / NCIMB 9332 / VKM B-1759) TaxID=1121448 RepID=T2GA01_MEGG1|nr:GTP-binding signal recognition particle SRP54 G- domain-containing protein [Megalodesulfovibrio gigas]AGW12956.1 putative GTP-binding signal recognition particle SRP54 G- domain-containing protein [Megalodesulfovibrio gigas DSM 1382 = ATCC 19364]